MKDECSPQEVDELLSWLHAPENKTAAEQIILQQASSPVRLQDTDDIRERLEARLHNILRKPQPKSERRIQSYWWMAAAVLVFIVAGLVLWPGEPEKISPPVVKARVSEPQPGKTGAILTLADGRELVLDSMPDGFVANQGNTHITLRNGKLSYGNNGEDDKAIAMNTITTPRGRQYQLELQDGTRVWLNAASSITYPAIFNGADRVVKVTGEAYFEVAKNKKQPFRVILANNTEIEVLGTHFNVDAYADEASINTTLLEGSVKVRSLIQGPVIMKPGEQVQVNGKDLKLLKNVDLDNVMAWKNGLFSFAGAKLETVMRQLSRWYDVDVRYEGKMPEVEFDGEIDKGLSLSQVLKGLTTTRINYRIENGNTIVILP
jgi:transmembrane sensor